MAATWINEGERGCGGGGVRPLFLFRSELLNKGLRVFSHVFSFSEGFETGLYSFSSLFRVLQGIPWLNMQIWDSTCKSGFPRRKLSWLPQPESKIRMISNQDRVVHETHC